MTETPMVIQADWNVPENVVAVVTTRSGGISQAPFAGFNLANHVGDDFSAVSQNRALIAKYLDPNLHFQWLQQQHGIAVVDATNCEHLPRADGLIARRVGVACCVLTADCLPIFFASKQGDEVAIVHAGWRGLVAGIIEKTIEKLNTKRGQLTVWLGPAIGPCHFEIGAKVKDAFLHGATSICAEDCFTPVAREEKYMANLYSIAKHILIANGVMDICGGNHCTYCSDDLYYSYRRDGNTGRMASIIYLSS